MKALNVNKLTRSGVTFKFWYACITCTTSYATCIRTAAGRQVIKSTCRVADWFAQLNNKMGGDLNKIQTVGKVMHSLV